eukprot:6179929-Pleurochrysis_carterae.AAC.2
MHADRFTNIAAAALACRQSHNIDRWSPLRWGGRMIHLRQLRWQLPTTAPTYFSLRSTFSRPAPTSSHLSRTALRGRCARRRLGRTPRNIHLVHFTTCYIFVSVTFAYFLLRVHSPDGSKDYAKYEQALAEAQSPTDETNVAATGKTVEIIKVMAAAAVNKMRDPKLAIADKLASQEGANSYFLNADAHAATRSAHN